MLSRFCDFALTELALGWWYQRQQREAADGKSVSGHDDWAWHSFDGALPLTHLFVLTKPRARMRVRGSFNSDGVVAGGNGVHCVSQREKIAKWFNARRMPVSQRIALNLLGSGRTTRLRRTHRPRSSGAASASTASHRTFVTIAKRPSSSVRRAHGQSAALNVLFRVYHDDDMAMTRRRSGTRERSWHVVLLADDDFTDLNDRR